jgi:hypothetical protein
MPGSDFAFIFEWSSCGTYTLNTFDNCVSVKTITSTPATATVDLVLSQHELDTIARKMADIDFYSYPDEFAIQLPPEVIRVYGQSASYHFDVQSGNQRKVLRWNDEFGEPADMPWKDVDSEPSKTQAAKLRELTGLIRQLVESHPEFSKLPSPGGCA